MKKIFILLCLVLVVTLNPVPNSDDNVNSYRNVVEFGKASLINKVNSITMERQQLDSPIRN